MKHTIVTKIKVALALQVLALMLQTAAFFLFTSMDKIVHADLYVYGLVFDSAWANPYWERSTLLLASITLSAILIVLSTVTLLRFVRNSKISTTLSGYVLPFYTMILNLFAIYIFSLINEIVHADLYNYGLQFDYRWGFPFFERTLILLALIVTAIVMQLASSVLIHFGRRDQIVTETASTKTTTQKPKSARLVSFIMITTGTAALLISIFSSITILALIGLGLIFWGILFIYIRTGEHTYHPSFSPVEPSPETATLDQIKQELGFEGKPIYLPPKYFINSEKQKAYISKDAETKLPTPETIQKQESQVFTANPIGMLVTAPGSDLVKLWESKLKTNFTRTNLQLLSEMLPKIIIEDLELAQNFEIENDTNTVKVKIEKVITRTPAQMEQHESSFGTPLASAIAIALAKSSGHPVTIDNQQINKDDKTLIVIYRIITGEASR
jgi:hypothetical protein